MARVIRKTLTAPQVFALTILPRLTGLVKEVDPFSAWFPLP